MDYAAKTNIKPGSLVLAYHPLNPEQDFMAIAKRAGRQEIIPKEGKYLELTVTEGWFGGHAEWKKGSLHLKPAYRLVVGIDDILDDAQSRPHQSLSFMFGTTKKKNGKMMRPRELLYFNAMYLLDIPLRPQHKTRLKSCVPVVRSAVNSLQESMRRGYENPCEWDDAREEEKLEQLENQMIGTSDNVKKRMRALRKACEEEQLKRADRIRKSMDNTSKMVYGETLLKGIAHRPWWEEYLAR